MDAGASRMRRELSLLGQAVEYEFRKVTVFRTGFFVREVLRGVALPVVMIFVFKAIFRNPAVTELGGRTERDLIAYLIMVMVLRKPLFNERGLDVAEQIFEGYVTKYLVMPFRYYVLALGRWVQYVMVQLPVTVLMYAAGALLFPSVWPSPASFLAVAQGFALVILGSFCFFLLTYVIHCLAFWFEVVWSLVVMSTFVNDFAGGAILPVTVMPEVLRNVLSFSFPYWSLNAPVELWNGHMGTGDFVRGLVTLGVWIAVLESLRSLAWARGTRRYTGGGM